MTKQKQKATETEPLRQPKILRPKDAMRYLQVKSTKFWGMVKDGQIRLIRIGGGKARAALVQELDALIEQWTAERDAA
jgi:hypothetical protein